MFCFCGVCQTLLVVLVLCLGWCCGYKEHHISHSDLTAWLTEPTAYCYLWCFVTGIFSLCKNGCEWLWAVLEEGHSNKAPTVLHGTNAKFLICRQVSIQIGDRSRTMQLHKPGFELKGSNDEPSCPVGDRQKKRFNPHLGPRCKVSCDI